MRFQLKDEKLRKASFRYLGYSLKSSSSSRRCREKSEALKNEIHYGPKVGIHNEIHWFIAFKIHCFKRQETSDERVAVEWHAWVECSVTSDGHNRQQATECSRKMPRGRQFHRKPMWQKPLFSTFPIKRVNRGLSFEKRAVSGFNFYSS